MMRRALNPLMGKSEKMSKPEVSPEEINKGTLVAVAVAAVAVIGIALIAMRKSLRIGKRAPRTRPCSRISPRAGLPAGE